MGNLSNRPRQNPQAIEWNLPWGTVLRGFRWGKGADSVVLLHEPGADLDAWTILPGEIARQLEIETIAVDLPGHGLSDDPWDPARLPELMRSLPDMEPTTGRRLLIAAGAVANAALDQADALELSGLICVSPLNPAPRWRPRRSPSVPKLFIAGSLGGNDLDDARRLATACGGWAIVTSLPVAERGTGLLASSWGGQIVEQVIAFLLDCQRRRAPAHPPASLAKRRW